jgi:hypothetical protein
MPLVRVLVLALALMATLGSAQAAPTLSVVGSDPGLSSTLGRNGALYLRLRYTSDFPIRVQAHGFARGVEVLNGVRFNPSPAYPAGSGEALAWIAYAEPVRLDEIRIEVADDRWRPLLTAKLPVRAAWTAAAEPSRSLPPWAERLSAAQQQAVSDTSWSAPDGFLGSLSGLLVMLGVPAYLVLQVVLAIWYRGAWRLAALAPLLVMLPLVLFVGCAVSAGSNIAPVLIFLAAPPCCLYLGALAGVRVLARPVPA